MSLLSPILCNLKTVCITDSATYLTTLNVTHT